MFLNMSRVSGMRGFLVLLIEFLRNFYMFVFLAIVISICFLAIAIVLSVRSNSQEPVNGQIQYNSTSAHIASYHSMDQPESIGGFATMLAYPVNSI